MKKTISMIKSKLGKAAMSAKAVIPSKKAEGYIDVAVKIIIGVVIGGIILSALYTLFDSNILFTLEGKLSSLFEYAGHLE